MRKKVRKKTRIRYIRKKHDIMLGFIFFCSINHSLQFIFRLKFFQKFENTFLAGLLKICFLPEV